MKNTWMFETLVLLAKEDFLQHQFRIRTQSSLLHTFDNYLKWSGNSDGLVSNLHWKNQFLHQFCWAVPPTKGKDCLNKQCSSRRHFKNLWSFVTFIIIIRRTGKYIGKKNWKEELERRTWRNHFLAIWTLHLDHWLSGFQISKHFKVGSS